MQAPEELVTLVTLRSDVFMSETLVCFFASCMRTHVHALKNVSEVIRSTANGIVLFGRSTVGGRNAHKADKGSEEEDS